MLGASGLLIALTGCAGPRASPGADAGAGPRAAEAVRRDAPASRAVVVGRAVSGAPILSEVFDGGEPTVLVFAAIHGDEPGSHVVATRLAELLRADRSAAGGRRVVVIANANPDGLERRMRWNLNGIDVNRNFPAANFRASSRPGARGGATPASEPETRAILEAMRRHPPALVLSIHSIRRGRECNNYDGPAGAIARSMSRFNGYPALDSIGYPTPGSFGSYAGGDLGLPVITLELPHGLDGEQAWRDNRAALLCAIAHPLPLRLAGRP